ncbi:hypothetical protein FQN55_003503 [Onygenales sp. PD_40]|nr:hypothetical protein FQN55_003503 [Onygenales sp. PD_40]
MYQHDHPAHRKLQEIGKEITSKVKPRAVVVFSAHWQGEKDTILVNNAEITELIYDFYGFPDHYYKEKYPNVGSREIAQKVIDAIKGAGLKAEGVKRGLDHGVWAGFKCAGLSNSLSELVSGSPARASPLITALALPLHQLSRCCVRQQSSPSNRQSVFCKSVLLSSIVPIRPVPLLAASDPTLRRADLRQASQNPHGQSQEYSHADCALPHRF